MKTSPDKASYKILLDSNEIPKDAIEQAFKKSEISGRPFLQILIETGLCKETKLLEIFSRATGCSLIDLKSFHPDPAIFERVPVKFASYYKFFPLGIEGSKLLIATSRILDVHTLDEMRFALGFEIEIRFAIENDIEEMLQKYYGLAADMVEKILSETPADERPAAITRAHEVEDIEKLAATPSVAHVVNQIILDAYKKRASDIHLEALSSEIRVRYRVDGVLQEAPVPRELKEFFVPMLSRIKIMANLNVAEKRLPQDGKLRVKTQDETLDLRVSFIPTANGESVVMRILPGKNVFKLEQLGFDKKCEKIFEDLLSRTTGIIFMTGPTGSGKSTTLYAALNRLNLPGRKIITIEDPVEYELDGINQIHVTPDIGLTFSSGLRSMLRQDPDVMMVGEVRDLETADIAIRAALTGHLILSTLHTNDAASGVTRLLDIGVEPYLIATSVVAFIAQRLVRVICPDCKEENLEIPLEIKKMIAQDMTLAPEGIKVFRGRGCEHCNHVGYRGRIAIHEFLIMNEAIRKLVMARATGENIKKTAVDCRMMTLRRSGWEKVLAGITTPEEIMETTEPDDRTLPDQVGNFPKFLASELQAKPLTTSTEQSEAELLRTLEETLKDSKEPVSEKGTDSRRFTRLRCRLPVLYRVVEYSVNRPSLDKIKETISKFEFGGFIANISPGGILFMTSDHPMPQQGLALDQASPVSIGDALEAGNVLELKINLPDLGMPVECIAKILRVIRLVENERTPHSFAYHVAMMFLAISSLDRNHLEKFCQHLTESGETT